MRFSARVSVVLLAFGHLFNDFYCNFLPVLLPIIMPQLDLSLTLSGLLIMVMSIASNMMQPVFGFLMDRHRMSWLLIPVIPFGAICICTIGFLTTKAMLFLLIALTGLSVSAFHPLGSSLVAKVAPAGRQGQSMSLYVAGGNIGFAFAPVVIVAYTQALPLSALPWLILPSLCMMGLYAYSGLACFSTIQETSPSDRLPLRKMLQNPSVVRLNIAMGLRCWTHVAVSTFLPLLLVSAGYSAMISGTLLTLFLAGCACGGITGGMLGDRFGHKRIILGALILAVAPTAYFFTHAGTAPLSLLALFLSGAFLIASQPSSIVWAQRAMPGSAGMASGMMMGLSFGFGSLGAALTAAIADQIGLAPALLLTTLPLILSIFVAAATPYPENARTQKAETAA